MIQFGDATETSCTDGGARQAAARVYQYQRSGKPQRRGGKGVLDSGVYCTVWCGRVQAGARARLRDHKPNLFS